MPTKTRIAAAIAALTVVTFVAAGCGSSGTPRAAAPAAGRDTIVIQNFAFSPSSLTVAPGATVTVHNEDSATHTVTGKSFDTGDIASGATKTFVAPAQAGSYSYICNIHQYMTGTLIVS